MIPQPKKDTRSTHARRRKRKGSSKWVKKSAALKHHDLKDASRTSFSPMGRSKYEKFEMERRSPVGSTSRNKIEIKPHRVSVYFIAWMIVWIVGAGVFIGIMVSNGSFGSSSINGAGQSSFSIAASTGEYATYEETSNGQVNYYRYVITNIENNGNIIYVTCDIYNDTTLAAGAFSGTPQTMTFNLTNTFTDVSMGMNGVGRGGGFNYQGGAPSGGFSSGGVSPYNGTYTPGNFGFQRGMGMFASRILVPRESDLSAYQDELQSQYTSSSSSGNQYMNSGSTTVTCSAKSITIVTSGGYMDMTRETTYTASGLLQSQVTSTTGGSSSGFSMNSDLELLTDPADTTIPLS